MKLLDKELFFTVAVKGIDRADCRICSYESNMRTKGGYIKRVWIYVYLTVSLTAAAIAACKESLGKM